MAHDIRQSLNILGTQAAVSESTDYNYTTPEEALILNRERFNARKEEALMDLEQRLRETDVRGSSYIGPPEGAIEAFNKNLSTAIENVFIKGEVDLSETIGEEELIDIVEASAFPGGGIGASIRGGRKVLKGQYKTYMDDLMYGRDVPPARGVSPKFDPLDRKLGISGNKKKFEYWQKQINRDSKRFSPEEMEWKYGQAYKDWGVQRKAFLDAMDNILGKEAKKLESSGKLMKPGEDLISKILKRNKQSLTNIELDKARKELQAVLKKYDIADPDIYHAVLDPKGMPDFPRRHPTTSTLSEWGKIRGWRDSGELPDIITQALTRSRN